MQDITDTLSDINPTDRVFRTGKGRFIKVRVTRDPPPPGAPSFGVGFFTSSGSECGPDGKALAHDDGYRICPPAKHTIHSDASVALDAFFDTIRIACVEATERAADLEDMLP